MKGLASTIQSVAPKAWEDLLLFYQEQVAPSMTTAIPLQDLPFELSMGILYRYFQENAVEWDVLNIPFESLPESLPEIFEQYEKSISHFS